MYIGVGNLFNKAAMFFGFIVVIRYVPKEDLGIFVIVLLISNIFFIINNVFLADLATAKIISSIKESKKVQIAKSAIFFKFLFSILICPIFYLSYPLLSSALGIEHSIIPVIFVLILFIFTTVEALLLCVLQGFHQYKKIALMQSFIGLIKFVCICILVAWLNYGIMGVVYSYIISSSISVFFMLNFLPFKGLWDFNFKTYKMLFRFGLPLAMNDWLSFIYTRIDRAMISTMMNPSSVAVFVTASQIPQNIREVYNSFYYVFFPNVSDLYAKKKYQEVEQIINNSIRLITFIVCFVSYIIYVFQVEITTLLFSEQYRESAPVLAILSFAVCVALPSNIIGSSLVAFGQSDKPVKINLLDTFSNVLGNLILIPIFGLLGAAVATLFSRCITNPLNLYFLNKTGIKIEIMHYIKPLLICFSSVLICFFINPQIIFLKAVLVLQFPIFCFLFSVIKKDDFNELYLAIRAPSGQEISL